jgi:exoribonuclease R
MYVSLPNTVEGLVPIENMKRHGFAFDKEKGVFVRKLTKKSKAKDTAVLRQGQYVNVRLVQADKDERKLTFVLY